MRIGLSLIRYGLVAIYGIFLSAGFSGIDMRKDTVRKLAVFTAAALAVQLACFWCIGLEFTMWIYPLILHLPLVIFLAVGYKKPWVIATVSVFLAYLCCQVPKWVTDVTYLFTEDSLYHDILYVFVISSAYIVLHRYAVKPVRKIMAHSPRAVWGLGLLPLLYYVFDYITTVYTDILYSGNPYVVQIMPSVTAIGYILFVLIYHSRLEEQEAAQQERYLLSLQLRRSQAEYTALCQMQEQARRFYHDLRHHTALLTDYAEKGALTEIKTYLQNLQQNLDTMVFKHYCGHPVIDLLLSHFESQADSVGVKLTVNAVLPSTLPFKDTELCSLLSNGLENAIFAASQVQSDAEKVVTVSLSVRQRNLLLSIQNPYQGEVRIVDGLPAATQSGHGLGSRSIASIVNEHGGLVQFSAANGIFLLRASLPMC